MNIREVNIFEMPPIKGGYYEFLMVGMRIDISYLGRWKEEGRSKK